MEGAGVQKLKKRQFTFVYENTKDSQREPDFNTFILIYIYTYTFSESTVSSQNS